ncbi:MAG: hypothetical protein EZS28_039774, partial [Streblomastix strix]
MKFRGTQEEAKEYKTILEQVLKENIVIPIKKEQIKWYNPTFMIKIQLRKPDRNRARY